MDRLKIAAAPVRRSDPPGVPPLDVCIEVNISGEASKSGVAPRARRAALANAVAALPNLRVRGIMGIPAADATTRAARAQFRALRALLRRTARARGLRSTRCPWECRPTSSSPIAEGATEVRVGTAIFGRRG